MRQKSVSVRAPAEEVMQDIRRATRRHFSAEDKIRLGALLAAVSTGLKRLSSIRLARLPRMADFAVWATACETAFWPEGAFMSAYDENQNEAVEKMIEASPVALAVRYHMKPPRTEWKGTTTELLKQLNGIYGARSGKRPS